MLQCSTGKAKPLNMLFKIAHYYWIPLPAPPVSFRINFNSEWQNRNFQIKMFKTSENHILHKPQIIKHRLIPSPQNPAVQDSILQSFFVALLHLLKVRRTAGMGGKGAAPGKKCSLGKLPRIVEGKERMCSEDKQQCRVKNSRREGKRKAR